MHYMCGAQCTHWHACIITDLHCTHTHTHTHIHTHTHTHTCTHMHTHTVPPPNITFSGRLVTPVDLSSPTLSAGTVFTLTCGVELVEDVDTPVGITTTWSKDGADLISNDRVLVSTTASQSEGDSSLYQSEMVFVPLSSQEDGGDGGNYTCSAVVQNSTHITGSSAEGSQEILVEGEYPQLPHLLCW